MRMCSKCGKSKRESKFFERDKNTGRLHAQCKACYKDHRSTYSAFHYKKYRASYLARAKARRDRLRKEFQINMLDYITGKHCSNCGEDDIRVLEFDHIDPTKKRFTVSQALKLGFKWNDVLLELENCQILCANCHKRKTAAQFNWYKNK